MRDIQFDENEFMRKQSVQKSSALSMFVQKSLGIANNERQAQRVLLGVALLMIIAALSIPHFFNPTTRISQSEINIPLELSGAVSK